MCHPSTHIKSNWFSTCLPLLPKQTHLTENHWYPLFFPRSMNECSLLQFSSSPWSPFLPSLEEKYCHVSSKDQWLCDSVSPSFIGIPRVLDNHVQRSFCPKPYRIHREYHNSSIGYYHYGNGHFIGKTLLFWRHPSFPAWKRHDEQRW